MLRLLLREDCGVSLLPFLLLDIVALVSSSGGFKSCGWVPYGRSVGSDPLALRLCALCLRVSTCLYGFVCIRPYQPSASFFLHESCLHSSCSCVCLCICLYTCAGPFILSMSMNSPSLSNSLCVCLYTSVYPCLSVCISMVFDSLSSRPSRLFFSSVAPRHWHRDCPLLQAMSLGVVSPFSVLFLLLFLFLLLRRIYCSHDGQEALHEGRRLLGRLQGFRSGKRPADKAGTQRAKKETDKKKKKVGKERESRERLLRLEGLCVSFFFRGNPSVELIEVSRFLYEKTEGSLGWGWRFFLSGESPSVFLPFLQRGAHGHLDACLKKKSSTQERHYQVSTYLSICLSRSVHRSVPIYRLSMHVYATH